MITRIKITDFQSHKATEIFPSPGVNIIVGRNNVGKSALLRALRLLFYNKPEGGDFVRWGAKDAIIEVVYDDHVIKRVKGSHNIYEVDDTTFSSFGKQIPVEVSNILGFHSIIVDRNTYELNFDNPHEAPFFISETDASKGKLFAKLGERVLSDLVLLDSCIHSSNADLRALNAEKTVLETQKQKLEESLESFVKIDELLAEITQVRSLLTSIAEITLRQEAMESILREYRAVENSISYLDQLTAIDQRELETLLVSITDIGINIHTLKGFFGELEDLARSSNIITSLVEFTKDPCAELEELMNQTIAITERLQFLRNLYEQLVVLDNAAKSAERRATATAASLKFAVEDYKQLLLSVERCPFCNRPIEQHDLEIILEELT